MNLGGWALVEHISDWHTRLSAAGVERDVALRSFTVCFGQLAQAGRPESMFKDVAIAISQLASKPSGYGCDVRQLQEYMPNTLNALLAEFGTADCSLIECTGVTGMEVLKKLNVGWHKMYEANEPGRVTI